MPDTPVAAAGSGLPEDNKSYEPITFRLPHGLKGRLRGRANAARRSLNSEAVVILERAVADFEAGKTGAALRSNAQVHPTGDAK